MRELDATGQMAISPRSKAVTSVVAKTVGISQTAVANSNPVTLVTGFAGAYLSNPAIGDGLRR